MAFLPDLRDAIWQFIGVISSIILSIISILLTIWIFKQQSRKELSYTLISNTKILSVNEDVRKKVQVLFNGQQVDNVRLITLMIWNSGSLPILDSDFVDPLTFDFGKNAQILDAEILEAIPQNLKIPMQKENECFLIKPMLLNKKEKFTVKILISKANSKIVVNSRFIGVDELSEAYKTTPIYTAINLAGNMHFLLGLISFIAGLIIRQRAKTTMNKNNIFYIDND